MCIVQTSERWYAKFTPRYTFQVFRDETDFVNRRFVPDRVNLILGE